MTKLSEQIQDTIAAVTEGVDPNEPKYCYCKQVSYGEMVGCDREDCPRQWFHFQCVGLTEAPPPGDVWLCPTCREGENNKARLEDEEE